MSTNNYIANILVISGVIKMDYKTEEEGIEESWRLLYEEYINGEMRY